MAKFTHQSLQTKRTIRLMQILPRGSVSSAPIKFNIQHRSLDDDFEYNALSYVWGDSKAGSKTILCQDGTELQVGVNLHAALSALERFDICSQNFIWIDAVCINQNDVQERTEQVTLMGEIYSKARRVFIYLGEQVGDIQATWPMFFNIYSLSKVVETAELAQTAPDRDADYQELGLPIPSSPLWNTFDENFFDRTWFTRRWVAQEAALAKDPYVIISSIMIPFSMLAAVGKFCVSHLHRSPVHGNNPNVINNIGEEIRKNGYYSDILALLSFTSFLNCTDARDRLYALHGLWHPRFAKLIPPDYSRSSTEIYQDFTASMILADKNSLRMLNMVVHLPKEVWPSDAPGLPSWVVDLTWGSALANPLAQHSGAAYNAAGDSKPEVKYIANILRVKGYLLGEVVNVGLPFTPRAFHSTNERHKDANQKALTSWFNIFLNTYNSTETPALEKFARTLVANRSHDGPLIPKGDLMSDPYYAQLVRSVVSIAYKSQTISSQQDDQLNLSDEQSNERYLKHIRRWAYSRRLVSTSRGTLGLAPLLTEPGDKICILYGGQTPFILRHDLGDTYTLVGESYMHGFMNGEAGNEVVDKLASGEIKSWKPTSFCLI
jgi:Heterokaryon incompatibility protein (HET)